MPDERSRAPRKTKRELQDDADKELARLTPRLKRVEYTKRDPNDRGKIEEVRCKKSDVLLKTMVPEDTEYRRERINGQMVIYKKMVTMTVNDYAEVTIEFDDGSRHVTPLAKRVVDTLDDDDLQAIWLADLKDLMADGYDPPEYQLTRKAVRIIDVNDGGGS